MRKAENFRDDRNGLFRTRTFLDSLYQAGGVQTLSQVRVWLSGKACPSVIPDPGSDPQQHRKTHSVTQSKSIILFILELEKLGLMVLTNGFFVKDNNIVFTLQSTFSSCFCPPDYH